MEGQAGGVLCILLLAAVFMDIRGSKIKNELISIGLLSALICRWLDWNRTSYLSGLLGILLPVISLFWLFLFHMLGAGDIKLFCLIGSFVGGDGILFCMTAAFLAGGTLALYRMIRYKNFKERFLYLFRYISAMKSESEIVPYYKKGDSKNCIIHFSVPIFIGTCVYMGVHV